MSRLAAGVTFLTFSAFVSPAATINIDINTTDGGGSIFSGVGAAPDPGTTWNGVAAGPEGGAPTVASFTSGPLITSTGAPSAITFSLGNFKCYEAQENLASAAVRGLLTDFVYQPVLGPGGPNATFAINNLNPAFTYDIYFYAQNGGYSNTATIFTIGATSLIATNVGPSPGPATFIEGTNYVKFSGISPSGLGVISGTFNDAAPANNAAFGGLQIVEVIPEPGTAATGLALAGLLAFRRRR